MARSECHQNDFGFWILDFGLQEEFSRNPNLKSKENEMLNGEVIRLDGTLRMPPK
jgi:hypothetical protein